ncbi:unnamed protein product [Diabrotica balteata]|uniref:Dynein heavy chain AAA module D4 domain-containing protein n=1 Tax=Diabrotica balteata TaxID=107213 RepID=A0A9N9T636_DIABA|nr:unnamed protein product [Diabrotica balteata]
MSERLANDVNKLVKKFYEKNYDFTVEEIESWLKHVDIAISLCFKALKTKNFKIGNIRMWQTKLSHLTVVYNKLKELKDNNYTIKWEDLATVYHGRIQSGVIVNLKHKDVLQFLNDAMSLFKSKILLILSRFNIIKVNSTFCGKFIKKTVDDEETIDFKYFHTPYAIIDKSTNLNEWFYEHIVDFILNKLSEFQERDSGWALSKVISLEININKYEIGNGSSYIQLPQQIINKKACVNVRNFDEACFYWSIVSALHPANQSVNRISSYPHYSQVLNLEGLEIPIKFNKIAVFEKLNNISINVYGLELIGKKFNITPLRLSKSKLQQHVNLLMIQNLYFQKLNDYDTPDPLDNEQVNITYHYCWIKNLSKLLNSQLNKDGHKKIICDRCLNYFTNQERLNKHLILCEKMNDYKIVIPENKIIKFKNFIYKQRTPFIIYADFESMLEPLDISVESKKYQKHTAFSCGYFVKCEYDNNISFFKSYRGVDCMDWFANEMSNVAQIIQSKIKNIVPMKIKPNTIYAQKCHICENNFKYTDIIVRDHNHFTGDFRGFAHEICNLNFKKLFVVPVCFHNLSGYDSHFIIRDLAKRGKITLLPINKEKYISFTQHLPNDIKFRFIDSLRFLGASLDELVSTVDIKELKNLKYEFKHLPDSKFQLLTRKGVFCYDYIDKWEKLDETQLPSPEHFYNKLNDEALPNEKYEHALNVWKQFNIQNLGEYSDLYLKTDIFLLADVFENFRDIGHRTSGLDPAWYYTIPGYSFDCMLWYTKCELELLGDVDMILFIEKGIRGGISQCCSRYSEANNKYMKNYDPTKPNKYLFYVDVNNLYGWAMSQLLPISNFKWVNTNIDVTDIPDDAFFGYILEVDIEYPQTLHDLHRDFPFCSEHQIPPGSKLSKLMTTLSNKKNYIIHYRALKQAIAHGLVITKIHRVLQFKQSAWLKPYIDLNTELRTKAKSKFEQNHFKLKINSIYGKTMENIRKHRIVKLTRQWQGRYGAKNLIASPKFHNRTIFDADLMAIEMKKTELLFNKPLYIGMSILDISKTCMYEFYYNYILPKLGNNCKIMYTDTDSFIFEIKCNDLYKEIICTDIHRFDTSNYAPNNPYNIPLHNKKVPGLMKDEASGRIITHFVGLRSKMYSYKCCAMLRKESAEDKKIFPKIWVHEVMRVFYDRLVEKRDRVWIYEEVKKYVNENFRENFDSIFALLKNDQGIVTREALKRLLFGTYFDQDSDEDKRYEEITDSEALRELAVNCLIEYNATHKSKMDIVLFDYALEHLSKICRILSMRCGSALLVGISGSGRQSLTRLAGEIYGMKLFQAEITNNYSLTDWRDDIKKVCKESGGRGKDTIFLIGEGQIKDESFLEDVDCLLNSGEVPNIYQIDEKQEILDMVKLAAQARNASEEFYKAVSRKTYITSASYLELIKSFTELTNRKQEEIMTAKRRYLGGLEKLYHASVSIEILQPSGEMEITTIANENFSTKTSTVKPSEEKDPQASLETKKDSTCLSVKRSIDETLSPPIENLNTNTRLFTPPSISHK